MRHIERPFGVGAQIPKPNHTGRIAGREIAMSLRHTPHNRRSVSLSSALSAAALALLAGRAAHAQSTWTNASGGNWGVNSNWNNGNVPDNPGESAIILPPGPYTVFFDNNYSINTLTIAHSLIRLDLQNNLNLVLAGGLSNAGTLTINNAAGANGTFVRIGASQTWDGGGDIVLNANAGNLDTAHIMYNGGGEVLTLASGTEILGSGRIYVSVANNGGIVADSFGRTLELVAFPKTNNNEFAAIGGGTLQLGSVAVSQGVNGIIRAFTGSTVSISNSTVNGGKIQTDAGGSTLFTASNTLTGLATAGTLDVVNNSEVRLADSLTNDGDIRVNSGSGLNNSSLRSNNSVALGGVGTITLRSAAGNPDTAYIFYNGGGEVLTQGAQHTIRGSGNIYVGMVNNGTISATTAGRPLRLIAFPKTNNKTISADSGPLEIDSTTINQGPAGVISLSNNAGASLTVRASGINSGLLQSFGNPIAIGGGATFNNTTISGPMEVLNNNEMRLAGSGTIHSGNLFVNSGSGNNGTFIRINASHTLSGNGRIVLRSDGSNLDTAYLMFNGGAEVLSQSAGHSITGTGRIYVALDNAGLVSADQNGKALALVAFGKSNSGVIRAENGGLLQVNSTGVTQTGAGVIRADNATVQMNAATITGGLVESINGGDCEFAASTRFNSVTFAGTGRVPNNQEMQLTGGFVNNGTLTVNPVAGANGTFIRVLQSMSVSGNGSIVLNANPGNLDTSYIVYNGGAEVLTNAAGHTIRGTGRIYVNLTNSGLVSADAPGKTLEMVGFPKTNNAILEATGGGKLQFTSVALTQDPGATVRAVSGGQLGFTGASVSGGTIESATSSLSDAVAFAASTTLSGVTLSRAGAVLNNNELRIANSMVNNSTLTVNSTAGNNGTYVRVVNSMLVDGTGSIVLNANPANLDTAYLVYNGGAEILTLGSGQTLAGSGNIYVRTVNNGILAPGGNPNGTAIGRLNLAALPFTQTADGIMAFEISGPAPSQFDRITGGASITLGGILIPSLINAYDPPIGTAYDIIDGPPIVGTFSGVGPGFTVQYFSNKVRVIYTGPACPADLNHDDVVDDADFVIFVPAYNILDCADPTMPPGCPADMNRDGVVDDIDFVIFLAQYNELLCPE